MSFRCRNFVARGWALLIFHPLKKVVDRQSSEPIDILYLITKSLCVCVWGGIPKLRETILPASVTTEQVLLLPNLGQSLLGQLVPLAALAVCKLS